MSFARLSSSSDAERRPERALLTPLWIGALVLLVVNDHFLKGSGALPGVVTGKLSDFAGLLVAPVLLASLVRARSHASLLACHVATGLVFAGIQLSTAFAQQWSGLMGLIGFPWTITCDPTDLIALPMLYVSWRTLVPMMDRPALVGLQRTAAACLSLFGLWSTVATSDIDEPPTWDDGWGEDGWYEDVLGEAYVNNANDFDVALYIRELRSDIQIDCSTIAEDPARLPDEVFGEAVYWTLPARTNVALAPNGNQNCSAFLVAGEGIPTQLMFWLARGEQWFPGQTFSTAELGSSGMAVEFSTEGQPARWVGGEDLRFTPSTKVPEIAEVCELPEIGARIEWSLGMPKNRPLRVLEKSYGLDGCFELLLLDSADESTSYHYLCMPEAMLPIAADEYIRVRDNTIAGVPRSLELELLDPDTLELAVDDLNRPLLSVVLANGIHHHSGLAESLGNRPVQLDPLACPWLIDEGCGTAELAMSLQIDGIDAPVRPGDTIYTLVDEIDANLLEARARELVLPYGRERVMLDASCSDGADVFGYDFDYAIVSRPAPMP